MGPVRLSAGGRQGGEASWETFPQFSCEEPGLEPKALVKVWFELAPSENRSCKC